MSSGCGDVLSLEDLKTAKKHQTFEAEVITGKAGGVASGADIEYASNQVTGQVQKTLPAILSDLGYRVASFTFITGGTLAVGDTDVAVLWPVSSGGDGNYYRWKGSYPKVVPANSTPSSSGGVSDSGWMPVGDITLRGDLASSAPGKGRNLVYDAASEAVLNSVKTKTDTFTTPERFSSLVTSGDWTAAINAAFDTSLPVILSGSYNVNGIINSKRQRIIGKGYLNTSRYSLGNIEAKTIDPDSESIRMLYVESAYDLSELLYIKSLGFNMINHYCTFANNGTIDAAGTAEQMLDNAYTAGLIVNLGLDNPRANANLSEFVNATKDHPATWGYSVYDEPATHGVTVAQQDAKISSLRALTTKNLNFVDLISDSSFIFNQKFSVNYDLAFVDSYSRYYSSGSYAQWLKDDLNKFRFDFGAVSQMTGLDVIPVVSAFIGNSGDSYYSRDVNQIVPASRIFGKVSEGNFGAFVWDGVSASFAGTVRNNEQLKLLVKELSSQRTRKKIKFDAYLFGGTPSSTRWGIQNIINKGKITDSSTSDANVQGNSYPIRLRTGASETDRTTTSAGADYSGIAFKGAFASYNSGIRTGNHVRIHIEYFNLSGSLSGTFSVISTDDNGYTISNPLYAAGVSSSQVISADITPGDISVSPESTLVFRVSVGGDTTTLKRKFIRGLIICSDW